MAEVALVTGASGGIGEDLARLIAADGRDVVLLARSAAKLQTLADELSGAHKISATVLTMDLSAPGAADDVTRVLAERRITVDMLVNNAGFGLKQRFLVNEVDAEHAMLDVLVTAVLRLTHAALGPMTERGHGGIINVSSVAAFLPVSGSNSTISSISSPNRAIRQAMSS